jgi:hypothetical protein
MESMKVNTAMEVVSAAHVSRFVGSPFEQRGALMFVAPPGQLKSTIIKESLILYSDTLILSDLNVSSLSHLKNSLVSGRYNSIGFGEFEKLYERNPGSAANLEGHMRALIEEGFDKMSFQSPEMIGVTARVLVVAGITPVCYAKRWQPWLDSGFARRFIWSHYKMADEDAIIGAIRNWKKLSFGKVSTAIPANKAIDYTVQKKDARMLEKFLDHQPSKETPYTLMKKIFCVLIWRYGRKKAIAILTDFSESLQRGGATLYI